MLALFMLALFMLALFMLALLIYFFIWEPILKLSVTSLLLAANITISKYDFFYSYVVSIFLQDFGFLLTEAIFISLISVCLIFSGLIFVSLIQYV